MTRVKSAAILDHSGSDWFLLVSFSFVVLPVIERFVRPTLSGSPVIGHSLGNRIRASTSEFQGKQTFSLMH